MKRKKPKAGRELKRVQDLATRIALQTQTIAHSTHEGCSQALSDVLERLQLDVIVHVDESKTLMDSLMLTAGRIQEQADVLLREIDMLEAGANAILRTVVDCMRQKELDRISGSHWEMVLKKESPQVVLDMKKIETEAPHYVVHKSVTQPNEALILEAIAAGRAVPGVELKDSYELSYQPVKLQEVRS